jgi:hypothetical protein
LSIFKNLTKYLLSYTSYEIRNRTYKVRYQDYHYQRFDFNKYYNICKKYSINVSYERFLSLYQALQYILKNKIKGDIVECGVFKGGSAMFICFFLKLSVIELKNNKIQVKKKHKNNIYFLL